MARQGWDKQNTPSPVTTQTPPRPLSTLSVLAALPSLLISGAVKYCGRGGVGVAGASGHVYTRLAQGDEHSHATKIRGGNIRPPQQATTAHHRSRITAAGAITRQQQGNRCSNGKL
ncbi:hypothetical protein E2C01_029372 [Portunus trituberculatus]|uniref:Uncharacterized protein n=1 Tax=Portunus trituberculatus TaxID=210409 RepID=A0A5B7ESQ4_PORTR|nr:hypothetical protein [Portunus trituberculatus]